MEIIDSNNYFNGINNDYNDNNNDINDNNNDLNENFTSNYDFVSNHLLYTQNSTQKTLIQQQFEDSIAVKAFNILITIINLNSIFFFLKLN